MSSENKYEFKGTPPPWKPLHCAGLGQHWYSVTDDKGEETQDIHWVVGLHEGAPNFDKKHEEKLSNIHLIAASPDLLEYAVIEIVHTKGSANGSKVIGLNAKTLFEGASHRCVEFIEKYRLEAIRKALNTHK